jgi:hypothetical protein
MRESHEKFSPAFFQKAARVEGAKPSSRPQARNFPYAVSFRAAKYVLLCARGAKKNGKSYLM